ncbi:uncharacterized protein SCHCODRAFT_02638305 [Schizophyllum commune H4-8]|nr:uncharacterized protein SCHCODRAFT_02638305 [Schizophyllum commune H4-8]KAI5887508.1 hypothetical protein SCHCODRAFT_02638305 [Schizophyllum commune H4-8]
MPEEPRLPLELLIMIVHTVLADSFHTIFSVGNEVELEWQLNVIATLSLTNSTFHTIVADSVKELMDLKPTPARAFHSREFLGDILALGRQQRDPGAPSLPDRTNRRFLSTLLKGYQQFVLIIALRTMFHRLGKAKTDIIPLNHLVDRVTAKMLAQLAKIRPGAVAEPLRRMAETERGLSRILTRATSASETLPELVQTYICSPSSELMTAMQNALRELELCTEDYRHAMKDYQYASTVVPFFRVFGIPEDVQTLDSLPAVYDTQSLLERYARLKRAWDEIDPGTDLVCVPLPVG